MISMKLRTILSGAGIVAAVAALLGSGFLLGFRRGQQVPAIVTVRNVTDADPASHGVTADFGQFWQVWQLIQDQYLRNDKISGAEKVYGATRGLVSALGDPHSEFFPPEESKLLDEHVRGNFGGIGAEIGIRKERLVIVAPLKNTPAERAGLKAGDFIVLVNGSSTDGLALDEAISMIRGVVGTDVTLNVFRDAWEKPRDFKITRAVIEVPTVDYEMLPGGIARISLYSFNGNAVPRFGEVALRAKREGAKGIVLDLRNDPGGYLDAAIDIAGFFLPRDTLVVSEVSKTEPRYDMKSRGNDVLSGLPLSILMNRGSASASEIVAGALRDHLNAPIIGEQSYGKGTVQEIFPVTGNSTVKLTVAQWVMPKGGLIDGVGLKPDYEVQMIEDSATSSDAKPKDVQLEKAIEVLRARR